MAKRRKQVTTGDGITERRFELEQLVYPVTSDELDEYYAGEADYSSDPLWAHVGPELAAARGRLHQLERQPGEDVFAPHIGEGWYCQRLLELGERISRFAHEYELAANPLVDAVRFGQLLTELDLRRRHNPFFSRAKLARDGMARGGARSRKRPLDEQHTFAVWQRHLKECRGKKGLADQATAEELGIGASTVRRARKSATSGDEQASDVI